MQKANTHFEQVPVRVVERIVAKEIEKQKKIAKKEARRPAVIVKTITIKTEPYSITPAS